jgi:S-(hydroxymethyl)glutathione dehydrogenase/alcohol dehydrogenase
MKAAVLTEAGAPLVIEDLAIANPGPHEVLIRTVACGLCHSDLHFMEGTYPHAVPCVPGHEAAGIVEAVGTEVRTVKVGDAVVTCLSAFCGHCEFCVTGRMALCLGGDTRRRRGAPSRLTRSSDGTPVHQMLNLSAFAEMMLIHENACVRINPDMPLDRAALMGCAVTTGAGTVFNVCKVTPGETVAVVGCGGVGLATVNAAKIAGAGMIIAADPMPEKRDLAMKLGATHAIDPTAPEAAKELTEMTRGGVDHAIEVVGRAASAEFAVGAIRRGGTATIVGMHPPGAHIGLSGLDLLSGKRLQGALMGMNRFPVDLPRLVDFYMRGLLDLDLMIAERIALKDVNDGFSKMKQGHSARSVIVFS